ncbi:hypothetical protein C0J50_11272 [Silurus asotus]|uniref:Alkylated DNA repair protein AlkB homologue 8 N-terminal domain-containing protein n=1 Tax=Silurus asotus TaxID=30991 RepID=A0AAD5FFT6_SILAS|nr:hypothetical protein C0J50_11272 [Silurus asotus]
MENILRGACSKAVAPKRLWGLPTSSTDLTSDEDIEEVGAHSSPTSGDPINRSTSVCLPTWQWSGRHSHLPPKSGYFTPGKGWEHLVNIQEKDIVRVDFYKYLGVHLNNKLDWTDNTEAIYKKGQNRLFLLRRLRSFGVQGELLKTFFCLCCGISHILWGGLLGQQHLYCRQEETRQADQESQLSPGGSPGHCTGVLHFHR